MLHLGTSGYAYPDWKGIFYPTDLPQSRWLEYYAGRFLSVELNVTFYRLPATPTFDHWRKRTPKDFRFVLKGSRVITHDKRLEDCDDDLLALFERASHLEDKLSAVLWQLPTGFVSDLAVLTAFFDKILQLTTVFGDIKQVIEFRDPSWFTPEIYQFLQERKVAIALADWPYNLRIKNEESGIMATRSQLTESILQGRPTIEVPQTTDFFYFRRHGPAAKNASPYDEEAIDSLVKEVIALKDAGQDSYLYFNNTIKGYGLKNAEQLLARLSSQS